MNKTTCGTCMFWSERIAKSEGCGPIEALCLSECGPHRQKYIKETHTCEFAQAGPSIDGNELS